MNSSGDDKMYYIHKEYLGSYETVTDDYGQVVEKLSFDPCSVKPGFREQSEAETQVELIPYCEVCRVGRRRNPQDWTYNNVPTTYLFDRGFTGHEHLDNFDLINMNGRVYDPWLGRFLSPDNFVQAPEYSQNFNRYSYALNNPLKYTDPSGEFLTWSLNNGGFSIGLNFTPVDVPLGFGLNFGWANGFSIGVYGEIGPRFGGTGLGSGFTVSQSLDYNFKYHNWSTTTSEGAYVSVGPFYAGANISYTYDISNKRFTNPSWGVSAGIGIGNERGVIGLYAGYGSGGWSYGIGGYYNPERPKIYKSPISNNYGGENGECVFRCLEEFSNSYGMEDYDFDYWLKLHDGKLGVSPKEVKGLIEKAGEFSSFQFAPQTNINELTDALTSNKRVMMGLNVEVNGEIRGHAVMVKKVKVWSSGRYKVYFSETSPVRLAPRVTSNLFSISGAVFWSFYPTNN